MSRVGRRPRSALHELEARCAARRSAVGAGSTSPAAGLIRVITYGALKRLSTTGRRPSSASSTSISAGIVGVIAIPQSASRARRVVCASSDRRPPAARWSSASARASASCASTPATPARTRTSRSRRGAGRPASAWGSRSSLADDRRHPRQAPTEELLDEHPSVHRVRVARAPRRARTATPAAPLEGKQTAPSRRAEQDRRSRSSASTGFEADQPAHAGRRRLLRGPRRRGLIVSSVSGMLELDAVVLRPGSNPVAISEVARWDRVRTVSAG